MIEFKPVRLEDKQIIERHTMPSGILNCDLAFANMYCWQAMYHSAWAVIDGFLVIRFHIGGSEKIGYKIREAQKNKIPYMLVVGEKEAETDSVSVRTRKGTDGGAMSVDEFVQMICEEIREKRR